ncbi:MAG: hypothetical protein R2911_12315 [Caldilineaceae bacterium]
MLYCLSNMPVERYAWLRQSHDFWPLFAGIIISGEIQLIKPDAAIYQHLLQNSICKPMPAFSWTIRRPILKPPTRWASTASCFKTPQAAVTRYLPC